MKIREILRSDLIYIPSVFLDSNEGTPYPILDKNIAKDLGFYYLNRIQQRDQVETIGQSLPWNVFVAIPQGNVVKGFVEVVVEQRFFTQPRIVCRVLQFCIDAKSLNRGIAKELFKTVIAFGAQFQAQAIEVMAPLKSKTHAFWAKAGAKTFSVQAVFAKNNWELFNEGDFEWASDHMQEEWLTGSMETKIQKAQQESTEMSSKEKEPLTLVKAQGQ